MQKQADKKRKLSAAIFAWLALVTIISWTITNWPQAQPGQVKKISAQADGDKVKKPKSTDKSSESVSVTRAEVVAEAINFRSRPEMEDRTIIQTLAKGTVFKVIDEEQDWLYVQLEDGQSGYVVNKPDFVQIID